MIRVFLLRCFLAMFDQIKSRMKPLLRRLGLLSAARMATRKLAFLTPQGRARAAEATAFYGQFIHAGDLCFDIGANMGDKAQTFLDLGARVVCVEPQPPCIKQLRSRFRNCKRITFVERALGEKEGSAELAVAEDSTVATMSEQWKSKGRFASTSPWTAVQAIQVTTLDAIIAAHGMPAFCKIDVEGFEVQVISGLTQAIPQLSFEFTSEFISDVDRCVQKLASMGSYLFNYSVAESMRLAGEHWVDAAELTRALASLPDRRAWGDVYARLRHQFPEGRHPSAP